MSGLRRNTKRVFTNTDKRSFYLVANDVFFGLVFSSKQSYYYKNNRTLVSVPSVLYYSNQTKIIFDYSNSKNKDDLSYVSSFFNSLTSGQTFAIDNATYTEDSSGLKADVSGVYTFESFEQGNIVKASVVSTIRSNTRKDFYDPKFFTSVPQLSKIGGVSTTQQKSNLIKNTLSNGLFSFKRMGVQIDDYIEFSGTTNNKWKKLKIIDLFTDTDGFETIQVDSAVINEDLIGQPVLVNLYLSGDPNIENANLEKTYGTCLNTFSDGTVTCIPCQNNFLCSERSKNNNSLNNQYIENSICTDVLIQTTIQQLRATQQSQQGVTLGIQISDIQNISGVTLPIETDIVSITRPKSVFKTESIKIQKVNNVNTIISNGNKITNIDVAKNTTLKISLSDPTLIGYSFVISTTNPTQKITEDSSISIKNGTPGKAGSYISVQSGKVDRTYYLSTSDRKLIVTITVK